MSRAATRPALAGVNGHAKDRVARRGREADPNVPHIADWMAGHHPTWGVDVLLTRPVEALRLGLAVAVRTGRITRGAAGRCERALAGFEREHPEALAAAGVVCRAAMCARKRGSLRAAKPAARGAQQA